MLETVQRHPEDPIPHVNNTKVEEICSHFCPAISFLDL